MAKDNSTEIMIKDARALYTEIMNSEVKRLSDNTKLLAELKNIAEKGGDVKGVFNADEWCKIAAKFSKQEIFGELIKFFPFDLIGQEQFYKILLATSEQYKGNNNLFDILAKAKNQEIFFTKDQLYNVILKRSSYQKKSLPELFELAVSQGIEFSQYQVYQIMLSANKTVQIEIRDRKALKKIACPMTEGQWFDIIKAAATKCSDSNCNYSSKVLFFVELAESSGLKDLDVNQCLEIANIFIRNNTERNQLSKFMSAVNKLGKGFNFSQWSDIYYNALNAEYNAENIYGLLNTIINYALGEPSPENYYDQICLMISKIPLGKVNFTKLLNFLNQKEIRPDSDQFCDIVFLFLYNEINNQHSIDYFIKNNIEKLDKQQLHTLVVRVLNSPIKDSKIAVLLNLITSEKLDFDPEQWVSIFCHTGKLEITNLKFLLGSSFKSAQFTPDQLKRMISALNNIKGENLNFLYSSLKSNLQSLDADQLSSMICYAKNINRDVFSSLMRLAIEKIRQDSGFFSQNHIYEIITNLAHGDQRNFASSIFLFGPKIKDFTEDQLNNVLRLLAKAPNYNIVQFLAFLRKQKPTQDEVYNRILFLIDNDITNENLKHLLSFEVLRETKPDEPIKLSYYQWKEILPKVAKNINAENLIRLFQLLHLQNPDLQDRDLQNLIPYLAIQERPDLRGQPLLIKKFITSIHEALKLGIPRLDEKKSNPPGPDKNATTRVEAAKRPLPSNEALSLDHRSKRAKEDNPPKTLTSPKVVVKLEDQEEHSIDPKALFLELIKKVRGESNASLNCTHLATDILTFLSSGKYPDETSKTTKFSSSFFGAQIIRGPVSSSDQVRIKQEEDSDDDMVVEDSTLFSTVDEKSKFFEKPIDFIFPSETTYIEEETGSIVAIPQISISDDDKKEERKYPQYSTTQDQLTDILKKRAIEQPNKCVCGLVNFAPKDQNQTVGHQIAFYATMDQVYYFDPQLMSRGKLDPKNSPLITDFEEYFSKLNAGKPNEVPVVMQDRVFYMLAVAKTLPELNEIRGKQSVLHSRSSSELGGR